LIRCRGRPLPFRTHPRAGAPGTSAEVRVRVLLPRALSLCV